MARSPIEIPIASETKAFKQGIDRGVIKPLEDAERQLKQLGDSNAGGDVDRDLRKAQDASKDLAGDVDRTRSELEKMGRAARDAGDDGRKGMRRIADAGSEVSSELKQNLGETFSSFRGDLQDLPQIAQDTLGGLAGSGALGGIPGLVATAAGAAGLGLLIGAFEKIGDEQERLKELAREWAEAYIQNGGRILDMATVMAKTQAILNDRLSDAETNAGNWGVSLETAVAAMAGSSSAIDEVTRAVEDQEKATKAAADTAANANDIRNQGLTALTEEAVAADHGRRALDELTGAMALGGTQADIYSRILADQARSTQGATEAVDQFGDSIITLPDGKQVYIDAETKRATENVQAIEQKIFSVPEGKTVRFDVDDSAIRNWRAPRIVAEVELRTNGRIAQLG